MRYVDSVIVATAFLSVSFYASVQTSSDTRTIVLPNPQLIHCRAAACSQLWKDARVAKGSVYPAQVLTDVVDGEVVGLTAVYDKSVSTTDIREAIDGLYGRWKQADLCITNKVCMWRVEPEQFVIQLAYEKDRTQLTYLKFVKTASSLVPTAHIFEGSK